MDWLALVSKADQLLKKAEDLDKQLNEAYLMLKESERKKMESEIRAYCSEARALYEEALKLKSDKYTWLKLGNFYASYLSFYSENEKLCEEKAIECYVNALKEHMKDFPEVLKRLGSERFHRIKLMEEIENLFDIRFFHPDLQAHVNRLDLRRIEHFQISLLKMYLDEYSDDIEIQLALAEALIEVRKIDDAEKICDNLLEKDPKSDRTIQKIYYLYYDMAKSSLKEKRRYFLRKAVDMLRRRCELMPDNPDPWWELAEIYSKFMIEKERRTNLDEAIRCAEEALKRYGEPGPLRWEMLACLYSRRGEKEKALECYSKAIDARLKRSGS